MGPALYYNTLLQLEETFDRYVWQDANIKQTCNVIM
jgi:hypothetical protein